jgi:hypothetical protein
LGKVLPFLGTVLPLLGKVLPITKIFWRNHPFGLLLFRVKIFKREHYCWKFFFGTLGKTTVSQISPINFRIRSLDGNIIVGNFSSPLGVKLHQFPDPEFG